MFTRLCLKLNNRFQTEATKYPFKPTTSTVLVIVESPNKVKLIESHLRPLIESSQEGMKRVKVMATIGHFMEMVDVKLNESFGVKWQLTPEKKSCIEMIRTAIAHPLISEVVLASDPDREGELIAAHVHDALFPKEKAPYFSRAYFYAMTKEMIVKGYMNRQELFVDKHLVESALARHIIDRMFGFVASNHLMLRNKNCRSIGRVQTPALNLIEQREGSIQEYENRGVTYTYSIEPSFSLKSRSGAARELKGAFCDDLSTIYEREAECAEAVAKLSKGLSGKTPDSVTITESTKSKSPPAPLTMVSLIDSASRILRIKGDAVTAAAQALFTQGLITYPRSDSERLSEDFENDIAAYVKQQYGEKMMFAGRRVRKVSKNAEGAHEAIRPTEIRKLPSKVQVEEGNVRALYALIHDHTVASRMLPVATKTVTVTMNFTLDSTPVQAKVSQSYVSEFGYLQAFDESIIQSKQTNDQTESKVKYEELLSLRAEDIGVSSVTVARHSDTKPSRFTEGTLITALKDAGIGRPSTYATTLQKLNERGYTKYHDAKGKLGLGPNGQAASAFARQHYQSFVRIDFTGQMENELNDIAGGEKKRVDVVNKFWAQLKKCLVVSDYRAATTVQEFTTLFRRDYRNFPSMSYQSPAGQPNRQTKTENNDSAKAEESAEKKSAETKKPKEKKKVSDKKAESKKKKPVKSATA
ncbi:DNA topoisomerase 1A [Perkinsela sp. CCAP 1560/4]|nr:DNA topoisomerase 1A [Perkinsela sp. CCAP 1560/4]|eukprot:KNH09466.1 DNA topoisomerase 1A [Perkinsela sp. CCAP 1560/4]